MDHHTNHTNENSTNLDTSAATTDLLEAVALPETSGPANKEIDIETLAQLHPNLLAQLDAAFRRHYWLVETSGVGKILDRHCRASNRGRKKEGLDGTLYYALQLTTVFATGKATIKLMYDISRSLPLDTRLQYGIIRARKSSKDNALTRKQLDTMTSGLKKNLDYNNCLTAKELSELTEEHQVELTRQRVAARREVVSDIVNRLIMGTLILDAAHGTYAIDDTAIWAWPKGTKESRFVRGGEDRPLRDEDYHPLTGETSEQVNPAQSTSTGIAPTDDPRDDSAEVLLPEQSRKRNPLAWLCLDSAWGGKSDKNGNLRAFFGYKAHVIVNTNDPARQSKFPILIQALELTPANADIVDVSLRLIDQIRARAPFHQLIGDRHYSYKKFNRWAKELWKRRINQVLDLRADKKGPVDQYGAKIIDGRPHCPGLASHLEDLAPSDDPTEQQTFYEQIEHRQKFACRMVKSPLPSPAKVNSGEIDPKVGDTRWQCPAVAGQVGCPLRAGTVAVANDLGMPTVPHPPAGPTEELPKLCTQETILIKAGPTMKYLQAEYWGSREWNRLYSLRTAVEGVFGNLKNGNTEDVSRGFTQLTGLPMVTLAITAAAACYNIRIIEKHLRESGQKLDHPLLNHPLDGEVIESLLLRDKAVDKYIDAYLPKAA